MKAREVHARFRNQRWLRASGQDPQKALKLHNVVLAAPDIDVEVAEQRLMAEKIGLSSARTTVYTSPADKAIGIAAWLFESPGDESEPWARAA